MNYVRLQMSRLTVCHSGTELLFRGRGVENVILNGATEKDLATFDDGTFLILLD